MNEKEYTKILMQYSSQFMNNRIIQVRYDKKAYKKERWNIRLYLKSPKSGEWMSLWDMPSAAEHKRALYNELIEHLQKKYKQKIMNMITTHDNKIVWIQICKKGFFYTMDSYNDEDNTIMGDTVFCVKKHATLGKAIDHIAKIEQLNLDFAEMPESLDEDSELFDGYDLAPYGDDLFNEPPET